MEENRTSNRNLRPPRINTNFTNRTRRRLNFNNISTTIDRNDKINKLKRDLLFFSKIIEKETIIVHVGSTIEVYDFEENETLELNPFNLDNSKVIFKAKNTYFQYPKSIIQQHFDNLENIVFDCDRKFDFAPLLSQIWFDSPYYLLRATGNFLIPLGDIRTVLNSSINVFDIKKTSKHLSHTTSLESVIESGSTGLLGQEVNITSADHCQAGSSRDVYELIPIEFLARSGGGIKFSKKKKTPIKTNNPFIVHTLTGTKKNIEKRKKSMNKAKKILGNNTRKNHLFHRRPQ